VIVRTYLNCPEIVTLFARAKTARLYALITIFVFVFIELFKDVSNFSFGTYCLKALGFQGLYKSFPINVHQSLYDEE